MSWGGDPFAGPAAGPWAICDRCGRQRRRAALKREWTQLMVCAECFDPRPVHLDPPRIDPREGGPIKDPRPETDPVFVVDEAAVTDPDAWSPPAPTPREEVIWITDDNPVTPDDL